MKLNLFKRNDNMESEMAVLDKSLDIPQPPNHALAEALRESEAEVNRLERVFNFKNTELSELEEIARPLRLAKASARTSIAIFYLEQALKDIDPKIAAKSSELALGHAEMRAAQGKRNALLHRTRVGP